MKSFKERVKDGLRTSFDISVSRHSRMARDAEPVYRAARDLELLRTLPHEHASQLIDGLEQSKGQLRQDLFVLSELGFKREGWFVEFGATNGVDLSNTHLLEKQFGWTGILAEPARCWHEALKTNRSAIIEPLCVWKDSTSTLSFNEVDVAELSTIDTFSDKDLHKGARRHGKTYDVRTISLNDLLDKHGAPRWIDYLSIDTEGSELDILQSFDFERHAFRVITCEHNYTPDREKIFALLSSHGYVRKHEGLSHFDDWYVAVGSPQ